MHAAEEIVDSEIGEEDGGGEDQGVDVIGTWTLRNGRRVRWTPSEAIRKVIKAQVSFGSQFQ